MQRSAAASSAPSPARSTAAIKVARDAVDVAGQAFSLTILERTVNGQLGLAAQRDGVAVTVFAFDVAGDRIEHTLAVRNPEKLRPWTAGWRASPCDRVPR